MSGRSHASMRQAQPTRRLTSASHAERSRGSSPVGGRAVRPSGHGRRGAKRLGESGGVGVLGDGGSVGSNHTRTTTPHQRLVGHGAAATALVSLLDGGRGDDAALATPSRVRLLSCLSAGPRSVGELVAQVEMEQSAVYGYCGTSAWSLASAKTSRDLRAARRPRSHAAERSGLTHRAPAPRPGCLAHPGRRDRVSAHPEHGHHHDHTPGHGRIDPSIARSHDGLRVVATSLAVLGVTAVIQIIIYAATGSVALLADLIHNAGDALTAIPLGAAFILKSSKVEKARRLPRGGDDLRQRMRRAAAVVRPTHRPSSALRSREPRDCRGR